MTDDVAQPSMSMTRTGMCGARWETYLLYDLPVHAVCYQVGRFLLLEDKIAKVELAEWMWQL